MTRPLTLGAQRDGGGGAGRASTSPPHTLDFLLCVRPDRGLRWRPRAYSTDGETEARFGTLDALIPESSPSVLRLQIRCLFSRVKIADQGSRLAETKG